jgi:hypothetical protein
LTDKAELQRYESSMEEAQRRATAEDLALLSDLSDYVESITVAARE